MTHRTPTTTRQPNWSWPILPTALLLDRRTYWVVLSGLLTTLTIMQAIVSPLVEYPPSTWRDVPGRGRSGSRLTGPWVLLPSDARAWCIPHGFLGVYEIWRPTPEQVVQLERDLALILPVVEYQQRKRFPEWEFPDLTTYPRQYLGIRQFGEIPYIYVNAFLSLEEHAGPGRWWRGWRRDLLCVEDGGWGYWHLQYDPVHRRFRGFSFNGTA